MNDALRAVLVDGVYGSGKSTLAVELVDRLAARGDAVAAIDLDWLGWYGAPVDWDEHIDPRITIENLRAMVATYRGVGVRTFVLAHYVVDPAVVERLEQAIGAPLTVLWLDLAADVLIARLTGDPNASRQDDLERALAVLSAGDPAANLQAIRLAADIPVGDLADAALAALGWEVNP